MLGLFENRRPDWTHQRLSYSVSHTSTHTPRSTLDGSRVQISRNQFGLIWSKLSPWVYRPCLGGPSLASWFSNSWAHFLIWTNWFSLQKCCHAFSLDLPLLVLDPHLKAVGPIYGSPPIRLLYFIGPWTLDLGPWSKVALTAFCTTKKNISSLVFHRVLTGCQRRLPAKHSWSVTQWHGETFHSGTNTHKVSSVFPKSDLGIQVYCHLVPHPEKCLLFTSLW
jgi:hypothetical protein